MRLGQNNPGGLLEDLLGNMTLFSEERLWPQDGRTRLWPARGRLMDECWEHTHPWPHFHTKRPATGQERQEYTRGCSRHDAGTNRFTSDLLLIYSINVHWPGMHNIQGIFCRYETSISQTQKKQNKKTLTILHEREQRGKTNNNNNNNNNNNKSLYAYWKKSYSRFNQTIIYAHVLNVI